MHWIPLELGNKSATWITGCVWVLSVYLSLSVRSSLILAMLLILLTSEANDASGNLLIKLAPPRVETHAGVLLLPCLFSLSIFSRSSILVSLVPSRSDILSYPVNEANEACSQGRARWIVKLTPRAMRENTLRAPSPWSLRALKIRSVVEDFRRPTSSVSVWA